MLGQATLFAHEALHDINVSNDSVCTTCLNSPLYDGVNPPAALITDVIQITETAIEQHSPDSLPVYFPQTAQPRAPPSYS